jgi:hypothetical protein
MAHQNCINIGYKTGFTAHANDDIFIGPNIQGQGAATFTTASALAIGSSQAPKDNLIFGEHGSTRYLHVNGDLRVSGSFYSPSRALSVSSNTASMDCSTRNFFTLTLQNGVDTLLEASNIQEGQSDRDWETT